MKKTVANRRMFRQGGAVNSGPTGILASSPSLIDAVAQDAMNVQGGPTVRMADGGIVRMANGGVASRGFAGPDYARMPVDSLTPNIMPGTGDDFVLKLGINPNFANRKGIPVLENLIDSRRALKLPANVMAAVGSRDVGDDDTVSERYMRLFPESLEPGGADQALTQAGQPVSRMDEFLYGVKSGAAQSARNFGQSINALTDVLTRKAPAGQERSDFTSDLFQTRAVMEMKERRPDLAPEIDNLVADILKEDPEISADALRNTVAYGLEKELIDKAARIMERDPTTMDEGDTEDSPAVDAMRIDLEKAENVYGRDLGQDDTLGEEDESDPTDIEGESDPTGEAQRSKAQGQDADTSFLAGVTPPRKPDVEDPNIADEIEAAGTPTDAADAAKQVASTFNKTDMKPEEAKRGMEYYLDRFKKAMPKYEGMSESEKGMIIAEAGLKVMAGQSPDAITNIAEGLKGVSKEFIADNKERRAYNRQVDLSAAKYGFAQLDRDRAEMLALAKEGRQMPYQLVANKDFEFEGQKIKKGQAYPLTRAQIDAGLLQKLPLTYRESFISDVKAALALAKKTAEGREKPGAFTTSRETYLANARSLKNGARMKGLLMEAASIAIPENAAEDSKVLGAVPLIKSWTDKALNAAGYQANTGVLADLRSTEPEKYRTLMKTIGTTMVTEILNESNKTISEGDRARVDDLVAAYADYDGTVASYRTLVVKLKNLEASIDSGIEEAGRSMTGIESTWNNTIFKGGTRARDVLSDMRTFGTPLPTYSVGKRTSAPVYYKDIIDMGSRKFTPKYKKIFKVS